MSLGVGLLDYRHRWRIMRKLQEIQPSTVAPIVIGGCGSSGTTLLRHVLDRHPSIFCGPESTVFLERISRARDLARRFGFTEREILERQRVSRTQVEFIERFRTLCLVRSGKSVWADKTPENVRRFDVIRSWFPQARFIHVIRDGRDVVCSLRQAQWMKLEKITGGADRSSPEAVEACIRYWIERVTVGRRLRRDPRYLEVRYEDLVEHTEPVLRRILAFLNVDWDSRVLAHDPSPADPAAGPVYESAVRRWRTDLTSSEAEIVKRYAGLLLVDLRYEADLGWAPLSGTDAVRSRPGSNTLRGADDPGAKPIGVEAGTPAQHADRWVQLSTARQGWRARLIRDARVFIAATVDQRVPWYARLSAAAMPTAYFLAPIDPIPNRIPVIGHLDDAIVALLAIALFVRLVPPALRDRLRADLQEPSENGVAAGPRQREQVMRAAVTVLWLTVLGAITATWSALLVWGAIWLLLP